MTAAEIAAGAFLLALTGVVFATVGLNPAIVVVFVVVLTFYVTTVTKNKQRRERT